MTADPDRSVPAHFYVGLTNDGVQQARRHGQRAALPVWPRPSPDGKPGEWLPRVEEAISTIHGTGYVIHPGADAVKVIDADTLWEVEPDWASLAVGLREWRSRSARLLRRIDAFDTVWKQRTAVSEASRALDLALRASVQPSRVLGYASTLLDPAVPDTERAEARARLTGYLNATARRRTEKSRVRATTAIAYAAGRAVLAAHEPVSVGDALDWARRTDGFAVGMRSVSGHSLIRWLVWTDLSEAAKEAVRERERSQVQRLATELGLDIVTQRPVQASITVPTIERLPRERVPTLPELTAAAERYAVAQASPRRGDLCIATFYWMLRADPDRTGVEMDTILAGLRDEGVSVEGGDLESVVRATLEDASVGDGPFERLEGSRWRVKPGVPGDAERLNPAYLAKAAAAEGWDVIIPGSGYDYPPATPEAIIIVAGPAGPIDPIVRLRIADGSASDDQTLYEPFYFLTDPSDYRSDYSSSEISFEGTLEMGYSGFVLGVVLPERRWGMPDFRDSMVGWVSHSGSEVVCAWALPEAGQGTWERTVSGLDDGPGHPRFWLTIAREIARPA